MPSTDPDPNCHIWPLLARGPEAFESADVVRVNLAVAQGIDALAELNVDRLVNTVDAWSAAFARALPAMEQHFSQSPDKWKNDLWFFRLGMLQGFLGQEIGLSYVADHRDRSEVWYTDPGHLFLHGLIDTRLGTCATMPLIHVAISRRLGWPVSLACVRSHMISRFDDGQVVHNIEATVTHPGSFSEGSDEDYRNRFALPKRAVACGSDLRRLTMRQMLGVFLGLRARHHRDCERWDLAERDYLLARVLYPRSRQAYIDAMIPMIRRGEQLFDRTELGHPDTLFDLFKDQRGPASVWTPPSPPPAINPTGAANANPPNWRFTIDPDTQGDPEP